MLLGGSILAIEPWVWGVLAVVGVVVMVLLFILSGFISLWVQALLSGVKVSLPMLIMMRFRKVDPKKVVFALIRARKASLELPIDMLEGHELAGGNVNNVIGAMITAKRAGIELPWERATAIDLAGIEILIGRAGVAHSSLRPRGTVKLGDQLIDAMSDSDSDPGPGAGTDPEAETETGNIDQNTPVIVTDMHGGLIMVRPA